MNRLYYVLEDIFDNWGYLNAENQQQVQALKEQILGQYQPQGCVVTSLFNDSANDMEQYKDMSNEPLP